MEGTIRSSANYVPLSPLTFLERSAVVYADRPAIIYGSVSYTWSQTRQRCLRLAYGLTTLGISRRDVVAVLAPNTPAIYELHFGVPMTGAILCALNTRHDSAMVSVLLKHSGAKVLVVDHQLLEVAQGALKLLSQANTILPTLITISEPTESTTPTTIDYETLLLNANPQFDIKWPADECDPISLNYTSGTTSRPKGVIYTHRGAYLNAIATVLINDITTMPIYLWIVPMFHCNGWCLPWGIAAQGGTNICIRKVTAKAIFDSIAIHKATHMGGAPTVLNTIINAPLSDRKPFSHRVSVMTGAAPPPPPVLFKMQQLGFNVVHLYGLTETYGPATVCTWKPEWDSLPAEEQAKMKARQGLQHIGIDELDVKDPVTMKSVTADGKTIGEVMLRGNTVMSGYFKDQKATDEALAGGWFRSGDLGVKHADGYIQLKDRSKDIIISGGENISTIEVESVLFAHPAVLEAAVVARPDEHWGETVCAFVKLKDGVVNTSSEDIVNYCRDRHNYFHNSHNQINMDYSSSSNTTLIIFLSLATFTLLYLLQVLLPKRKPSNLPPGPTPFPIIGSLLELGKTPHRSLARLAKAHGPIISIKLGQTTTIVASSPQAAKQVLQTNDFSLSARAMPHVFQSLGLTQNSVVGMSRSPKWKHVRTLMKTHLFSTHNLEANRSLRTKKVEELLEHVRGRMGQKVDLGRALLCTMVNEISNLFFSKDLVDINSENAGEFKELVSGIMEVLGTPNISDFFPVVAVADLQGIEKKVEGILKRLHEIFDNMIDARLDNLSTSTTDCDFLDVLLRLHVEDESKLDRASIRGLLLDNFIAGSDTSSILVEWAMAELLRQPSIMEKARAELVSVVGPKGKVEESDIPQLPFLQAIVKETFRLHPSVPLLIPHKAETNVDVSGYTIPKDTKVLVNVWAIGHDDSVWADAELFKPERFIGSEVNYKGNNFELLPFGSGRRICPAMPLAHLMVHQMLGSLIHSFKWSLPNGMKPSDIDMTETFGFTVSLAVPLPAIPLPVN